MKSLLNTSCVVAVLRAFAVIGMLLIVRSAAFASGLEWERKEAFLTASPRQEKIELSFSFKNASSTPVTIEAARPSCDCTVAELGKKTYAPGESGELKVIYKIKGEVGKKVRTISVETNETGEPTTLTLNIDIPELVEVKPRLLVWNAGEAPVEKAVDIFMATEPLTSLSDAQSSDPTVSLRLETIIPARQYRLWAKPQSTLSPQRATINITTLIVDFNREDHFNVYVQIR